VETFCCTTYTIGGYAGTGAPGRYLRAYFGTYFPSGLTVPRPAPGSPKNIILINYSQVQDFLRATQKKPFTNANVTKYVPSTLEKQFVALKLNVGFDDNDPNFNADALLFGDLILRNLAGSLVVFNNHSVRWALSQSYSYLDGSNPFSPNVVPSGDLTSLLDNLNKSFDNGNISVWAVAHLAFPTPSPLMAAMESDTASPSLVTGEVWYDRNMNGRMDWNEPGMRGVKAYLVGTGGQVLGSTTTDRNGY
jgi:hypothetical protein